jgi:hypothetical protein
MAEMNETINGFAYASYSRILNGDYAIMDVTSGDLFEDTLDAAQVFKRNAGAEMPCRCLVRIASERS